MVVEVKRNGLTILAIDPGPENSAWLLYDCRTQKPVEWERCTNNELLELLFYEEKEYGAVVIERLQSYGKATGESILDTAFWSGRFAQAAAGAGLPVYRLPRVQVKVNLCGSVRKKDSDVRAALIARFGGETAIQPGGVLHGVAGDVWAALAVAVTWWDRRREFGYE